MSSVAQFSFFVCLCASGSRYGRQLPHAKLNGEFNLIQVELYFTSLNKIEVVWHDEGLLQ